MRRKELRELVTNSTLDEILNVSNKANVAAKVDDVLKFIRHDKKDDKDIIDYALVRIGKRYKNATRTEIEDLRQDIYRRTADLPDYNRFITKSVYSYIKNKNKHFFDLINVTGHIDEVLERSREDGIVVIPTHIDMIDPIIVAYPFLENGLPPPTFHMGANLKGPFNSWILKKFNSLFIQRTNIDDLQTVVYSVILETLIEKNYTNTVFGEGTRSRDWKIAPLMNTKRKVLGKEVKFKAMKRGFIGSILRANRKLEQDIYTTLAVINMPISNDLMTDIQKEIINGEKSSINTFSRITSFSAFEDIDARSGIYLHFTKPAKIPKSAMNNRATRMYYADKIRKGFKKNMPVLPENLLGYAIRYVGKNDWLKIEHSFYTLSKYILQKNIPCSDAIGKDYSYHLARKFYEDKGVISKDKINYNILVEANSNRIQHHFKKKYPLKVK